MQRVKDTMDREDDLKRDLMYLYDAIGATFSGCLMCAWRVRSEPGIVKRQLQDRQPGRSH